jgi:hypothetical protein
VRSQEGGLYRCCEHNARSFFIWGDGAFGGGEIGDERRWGGELTFVSG